MGVGLGGREYAHAKVFGRRRQWTIFGQKPNTVQPGQMPDVNSTQHNWNIN
jgi:hypothetical protein